MKERAKERERERYLTYKENKSKYYEDSLTNKTSLQRLTSEDLLIKLKILHKVFIGRNIIYNMKN